MRARQWTRADGQHWCFAHQTYHEPERFRKGSNDGLDKCCREYRRQVEASYARTEHRRAAHRTAQARYRQKWPNRIRETARRYERTKRIRIILSEGRDVLDYRRQYQHHKNTDSFYVRRDESYLSTG